MLVKKLFQILKIHIAIIGNAINNAINISTFNIDIPKPAKICNNVCPANIFANNRIDKLNGLIIYENISITINNGTIGPVVAGIN